MKNTILAPIMVLSLLPFLCKAQGSWERISVPTNRNLRAMSFTDSVTGWIAADSGMILHTTNGGKNWEQQESGTFADVASVFFLDNQLGWASCDNFRTTPYGTELLKTHDGGAHWIKQDYPEENVFITCILYLDPLNGWMGGKPHALVRTHDGGATWTQAVIDTSTLAFFPVLNINFYNERIGYAGGGMFDIAGVVWRTTDGGNRWTAIDPAYAPADEVHALHIFDSIHVLGAGGDPDFGYGVGLIRTADGGFSWNYQELGIQGNAYDISFRNDSEVWAPLGPKRRLIVSMDGGNSWTQQLAPDSSAIYKMIFPDTLHGYAIGTEGAFLRYKRAPVGIAQGDILSFNGYSIRQNYPNPFHSETTISFTVPAQCDHGAKSQGSNQTTGEVIIRIFDMCGKEVAGRTFPDPGPGDHELTVDGSALQPGVYFYKMELEGNLSEKTMPVPRKMIRY